MTRKKHEGDYYRKPGRYLYTHEEIIEATLAVYSQLYSHIEYVGKPPIKCYVEGNLEFLVFSRTGDGPDVPLNEQAHVKVTGIWHNMGILKRGVHGRAEAMNTKIVLTDCSIYEKGLHLFRHKYSKASVELVTNKILECHPELQLWPAGTFTQKYTKEDACFDTVEDVFNLAGLPFFPPDKSVHAQE